MYKNYMYCEMLYEALECRYCSATLSCFSVFQFFSLPFELECTGTPLADLSVVISPVFSSPNTVGVQLNCGTVGHFCPEAGCISGEFITA